MYKPKTTEEQRAALFNVMVIEKPHLAEKLRDVLEDLKAAEEVIEKAMALGVRMIQDGLVPRELEPYDGPRWRPPCLEQLTDGSAEEAKALYNHEPCRHENSTVYSGGERCDDCGAQLKGTPHCQHQWVSDDAGNEICMFCGTSI
jgi:hypothetical protein